MDYVFSTQVASSTPYDTTSSGLVSTDVQSAIDEILNGGATWSLKDDFITDGGSGVSGELSWTLDSAGGGTIGPDSTNVSSNHPGIVRLSATAGHASLLLNSVAGTIIVGGGTMYFEYEIFIPTLATVTNDYTFRCGLGDSATADFTNGIYFQYNRSTSTSWQIKTAKASTRTITTTSVVVATGWNKLRVDVNAAGTLITYTINGTQVGAISTNIPSVATSFVIDLVFKLSLGGVIDFDYFKASQSFTTPR